MQQSPCAAYGLLLRALASSFGRIGADASADRSSLLEVSFGLMHVVSAACTALARLPAGIATPGVHAGMTFTMLRGTEPLIPGKVEEAVITEGLRSLARAAAKLPAMQDEEAEKIGLLAATFCICA